MSTKFEEESEYEYRENVKFPDGIYDGEMKGDVKFGYGMFQFEDGRLYLGEFKNDKFDGQGEIRYYPTEERYIGEFRNGERHGIGVYRNAVGLMVTHVYEEGKLVKDREFSEFSKNYKDEPESKEDQYNSSKLSTRLHWVGNSSTPLVGKDYSGKHPRTNTCPMVRACWNFIEFNMKMDTKWFRFDFNRCFCRICQRRKLVSKKSRGLRGGSAYSYPLDWVKFGLPVPPFYTSAGSLDRWHVGFHGTRASTGKIIIEESRGGLLIPGDVTPSGFRIPVVNPIGRDEDWTRQFFMSPSIKYCETIYTPDVEFNGDIYKLAFQVRIEPETYHIGPATVALGQGNIDPLFPENENLEWYTNRRNVAVLSGLMVKRIFNGVEMKKKKKQAMENKDEKKEEKKVEVEEEGEVEKVEDEDENEALRNRVKELEGMVESLKGEVKDLKKRLNEK